jgi:putative chitinase
MTIKVTAAILRAVAPRGRADIIEHVAKALDAQAPSAGITTADRMGHFLAQASHETDGFKTLHEYASGEAYEGRKDLGNVKPGDGPRFKGRGIFQLTGRANYGRYGKRLGLDLERYPEKAADPEVSVKIALLYWIDKGLNALADKGDILGITKRINGGRNGLDDRIAKFALAKKALAA